MNQTWVVMASDGDESHPVGICGSPEEAERIQQEFQRMVGAANQLYWHTSAHQLCWGDLCAEVVPHPSGEWSYLVFGTPEDRAERRGVLMGMDDY